MKEHLFQAVEAQRTTLTAMADSIFDDPELGFQEFHAQKKLTDYLTQSGFQVETGTGGVETAFRAEFRNGQGGPRIGLLCEYDALEGLGHACGHHMQGPAIVGAAKALKDCAGDRPFSVVVYGTPAEETAHGKLRMLEKGCFQDIDVALMMHGSPTTTVDVKSMAMSKFTVTFHGKKSHAALKPEAGRSALDALLLAFQAVEFLREHVPEDTRMHYTISQSPGPVNVVPDTAVGVFSLRSYSRQKLDGVVERFLKIIQGAALMSDVTFDIKEGGPSGQQDPRAEAQRPADGERPPGGRPPHQPSPGKDRLQRLQQRDVPAARQLHPGGYGPRRDLLPLHRVPQCRQDRRGSRGGHGGRQGTGRNRPGPDRGRGQAGRDPGGVPSESGCS